MYKIIFFLFLPLPLFSQSFSRDEISRWEKQSQNVTIIRDNFGVPHIYGKTDADAVFGLMYAQCEDDFKRVEMNYIDKLGRVSEINGEKALVWDLLNRILFDSAAAVNDYNNSQPWMKQLCNAFADGINYFLYKNPTIKPALLHRFKPWYPYLWTDGSISAINTSDISESEFMKFYLDSNTVAAVKKKDPEEVVTGSNGFAIAPKITESGNALLYINPHVTFYFRPEMHMSSEQGLNVYGAVTWGQFFIYQGFNQHCGWMHTSSAVDAADSYIEKISRKGNGWVYEYQKKSRPVTEKKIVLKYRSGNGMLAPKNITVLFTHHGPVMAKRDGQYLSLRADNRLANGLVQCWQRNKARSFADFKKTLDLKGNISNNTMYADAEGNIAYWHGNRIPARDKKYDWEIPVDGTTSATEWKGYHPITEIVHSINPANGWLQNCNSTPYTAAGPNSPKMENYPVYMAPDEENFRGINAIRTLEEEKKYTVEKLIKAGYDRRLAAFEVLIPALLKYYESSGSSGTGEDVKAAMRILKPWDCRAGENSVATTLAIHFGEKIAGSINEVIIPGNENAGFVDKTKEFSKKLPPGILQVFAEMLGELKTRYGKWDIPWGEVNRFQRISSDIENKFDDSQPSIPVPFASATWGMLPSYGSSIFPGTKRRYGVHGNSFICTVEFGKRIKARSLLAGGQSGNKSSTHFFDQGLMYSSGQFKEVLFYKEDVLKQAERTYHPGK